MTTQSGVPHRWIASTVCLGAIVLGRPAAFQLVQAEHDSGEARVESDQASVAIAFEGFVLDPDGAPAEGAVVVSSAGGRAVADRNGYYLLEVPGPIEGESLQITAVGPGGASGFASQSVALSNAHGLTYVEPLVLTLTCQPSWVPTFGKTGLEGFVRAMAGFDDGGGPRLYAGAFAFGLPSAGLAMWDGSRWSTVDGGMAPLAFTVYDDGSGPRLYAGGGFTTAGGVAANRIAKWDGSTWSALGSGMNGSVLAFAAYDDGSGPQLYAGGAFTTAGGVSANRIAKWDGSSWAPLGSGLNGDVKALVVHDDGSGPALYVAGFFTTAGGAAANRIARWNGSSWTALGSGMSAEVHALAVYDDGAGPELYAGGKFTTAGGLVVNRIARWDGSSWAALGSGLGLAEVFAMAVHDDGSGSSLFVGGSFGLPSRVLKWDGSSWSGVGSGLDSLWGDALVHVLTVYDDGSGAALYAGGSFQVAAGLAVNHIAKWDGSLWGCVGNGISGVEDIEFGHAPCVNAVLEFDDGGGPELYAGGYFMSGGDVVANNIVKWSDAGWEALVGGGAWGEVRALKVWDDGSGPALFAGGDFDGLGKWNGSGRSVVGGPWSSFDGEVIHALEVFDAGSGPVLYAAGRFNVAGLRSIAKRSGSSWTGLGTGMTGSNTEVYALKVHNDGSGPALYVGGGFTSAGGVSANRIARWNGSSWSALGSGFNSSVGALAVYDDGSGPALYAGGAFTTAGGTAANKIARWNGSSWAALGTGLTGGGVAALAVHDDGSGPALYAGGNFTSAGGVPVKNVARWDGSSWTSIGGGVDGTASALAAHDDGTGPALFVGGRFVANDTGDWYVAKWGLGGPDGTPPALSAPTSLWAMDKLGSPPGEIVNFTVTAGDCHDPSPAVVCVPPSGSLFPPGRTVVTCTATDASGNQTVSRFPVVVETEFLRSPSKVVR